jgi:hypothetical protein
LEAIVVGEIQKSYNAYAGILKREADTAYAAVEELRAGPIAMPKDYEWNAFVEKDEHFIDPKIPIRRAQNIAYPGRDNELYYPPTHPFTHKQRLPTYSLLISTGLKKSGLDYWNGRASISRATLLVGKYNLSKELNPSVHIAWRFIHVFSANQL